MYFVNPNRFSFWKAKKKMEEINKKVIEIKISIKNY